MGPLSHLPVLLTSKGCTCAVYTSCIWEEGTKNVYCLNFKAWNEQRCLYLECSEDSTEDDPIDPNSVFYPGNKA